MQIARIKKLGRFCAVGGLVCGLDLFLVWSLNHWFLAQVAVSIAYFVAVTVHFCLNKWWVFENRDVQYAAQILRYGFVVLACWLCTLFILTACLHFVTSNVVLAKVLAIPPTTILGFLLMKLFVFRISSVPIQPQG